MTKALSLSNLEFHYQDTTAPVLSIERLQVDTGEQLFIKGPSGSGKSTLLSLITGVNIADIGECKVLGTDLSSLSNAQRDTFRADHLGYVFQMFNLMPFLSVLDNVMLALSFSPKKRQRLLAQKIDALDEAKRLLSYLKIDTSSFQQPASTLSIGQQQRVAVARALIGRPEIIVADEPTSALDVDAKQAFMELLFNECRSQGASLIFVSHDPELETMFDKTINMAELNRAGSVVS